VAKFRIAVIGHTGRGNYGHGIDTVWSALPECEIVGVADPDDAGRSAAAKRLKAPEAFADWREMLDRVKPNIVAICPRWLDQHRDMVVGAAERGIHMYIEKPLCRTLAEADEMVAACNQHQVKLALAHQTRYSPILPVIRDLIESDQIGQVLELRGRGKEDARGGGEDLWVLGSHVMNLMHHFGGAPQWCFGTVQQQGRPITKQDVVDGPEGIGKLAGDSVAAMYGMEDSVRAYFGSRRGMGGSNSRFGLQIYGSKGVIEVLTGFIPAAHLLPDPTWSPGRSGKAWIPISSAGLGKPEPISGRGQDSGNIAACLDLLSAIQTDRLPECSVYEGRTTVEMIAAVFESQRLGRAVSLPLETRENPLTLL
jgi:predicted dehydrogenase